jgi:HSP20 family molecular chaperone IbpA
MKMDFKIVTLVACLSTTALYADFVDIEREVFEPIREMQRMDEAMNQAIEKRRQENKTMVETQQKADAEEPMPEFVLYDKQYVLTKEINDPAHTKVDVKLEGNMVNISAVTTVVKKIVTETGAQDSSFESTTQESLSIPHDADPSSLQSALKDGQLRVTLNKK